MKKFSLAILALALVLGFALVGCKGGEDYSNAPILTNFELGKWTGSGNDAVFTPQSTFTTSEGVGFRVHWSSPFAEIEKALLVVKKGEEVWWANTSWGWTNTFGGSSNWGWGSLGGLPAGSYTWELYLQDIDGKKSETATASFTVTD